MKPPPKPNICPMKAATRASESNRGKFLGVIHFSLSCNLPSFSFSSSSLIIEVTLWYVVKMQIVMKMANIDQLYHPHIDKPIRDSNLGEPLSRLTMTERSVKTVHYSWILHCEQVDFSRFYISSRSSLSYSIFSCTFTKLSSLVSSLS